MSEEPKSYGQIDYEASIAYINKKSCIIYPEWELAPEVMKETAAAGASAVRAAVIEREGLKPPASIWHWTGEQEPEIRDADKNGKVLALDAGGSLSHTPWRGVEAEEEVQWCRTEDFFKACPPLVREEPEPLKSQHVADKFKPETKIQPDTSTLAGKIAVMQAALEGAEIEWRSRSPERGSDRWHPPVEASGGKILWNWIGCEYRVKPEPVRDELLPCPFCGDKGISGDFSSKKHVILCNECRVCTLAYQTPEEARAAWNQRAAAKGGAE